VIYAVPDNNEVFNVALRKKCLPTPELIGNFLLHFLASCSPKCFTVYDTLDTHNQGRHLAGWTNCFQSDPALKGGPALRPH